MIEAALREYGYLVVFLGSIIEGDGTLAVAAFLSHQGYLSLVLVILTAVVATTLANEGYFHAARLRGKAAFACRVSESPRYARLQHWVTRRGGLLLLLSRFLWGFRIAVPAICGVVGMSPLRFFLVNLSGALIWGVVVGLIGYGSGRFVGNLSASVRSHGEPILLTLIGIAVVSALIWHRCDIKGLWNALFHPERFGASAAEQLTAAADRRPGGFWARVSHFCGGEEPTSPVPRFDPIADQQSAPGEIRSSG